MKKIRQYRTVRTIIPSLLCALLFIFTIFNSIHPVTGQSRGGATITVDDDGTADHSTIQEAVDAAESGDTILVEPGTYTENVYLDKTVTLRGSSGDPEDTIIQAADPNEHVIEFADYYANYVNLSGFTVRGATEKVGIYAYMKNYANISNTIVTGNEEGIRLAYASECVLRNNVISGNTYNFGVMGSVTKQFIHDIDTSNTVDGKPIYYWVNKDGGQIPSDAGFVGIANSTNVVVKNLSISGNYQGVLLGGSKNCRVENVNASNNFHGISLQVAEQNTIVNNDLWNNTSGIALKTFSVNNTVTGNHATENKNGIEITYWSDYNLISGNNASYNKKGIWMYYYSKGNLIENNDVNKNTITGISVDMYGDREERKHCRNNRIRDNSVLDNKMGIMLEGTGNNTVEGNKVRTENGYGIYMINTEGYLIQNNVLSGSTYGLYLNEINNSTIDGNLFHDISSVGINIDQSSNGNSIVNNRLSGETGKIILSNDCQFNTIAGNEGGGIKLSGSNNNTIVKNHISYGGIFTYNVDYTRIVGNSVIDGTGIDSPGAYGIVADNSIISCRDGLNIGESYVRAYNNTIESCNGTGIKIQGDNHSISRNRVRFNQGHGIDVGGKDLIITDNIITHNDQNGIWIHDDRALVEHNNISRNNWSGIKIWHGDDPKIQYNEISNNNLSGLNFNFCYGAVLSHNSILSNLEYGVRLERSQNVSFQFGDVSQNGRSGFFFHPGQAKCCDNLISNVNINGNGEHGIEFDRRITDCTISNCFISSNAGSGVLLQKESNWNKIDNTWITENSIGINISAESGYETIQNRINKCRIEQNSQFGIYLHEYTQVNIILQNQFIDNGQNAFKEGDGLFYSDYWSGNSTTGGNYWSDFDESSEGAYDNDTNGIIDTEYIIPERGHEDSYPLAELTDLFPPKADAGEDQTIPQGTEVTFDGTGSSDDTGVEDWNWTFLYGGILQTLEGEDPSFTFLEAGTYTVTLVVSDAMGNQNSDEMVVVATDNNAPDADAGDDITLPCCTLAIFDGSHSNDNLGVVNWTWTFEDGDEKVLFGMFPFYVFSAVGTYEITLTVVDGAGLTDSDIVMVTVFDYPSRDNVTGGEDPQDDIIAPTADAGLDINAVVGASIILNGNGSTDNTGIVSYTWTFDDNGAKTLTGMSPTYTFASPGIYTITLLVADLAGNEDTDTMEVKVVDASETGNIDGTVMDEDGDVVSNANIEIEGAGLTTTSDTSGVFTFTGVPAGTYTVKATMGNLSGSETATVDVGGTATVSITMINGTGPADDDDDDQTVEDDDDGISMIAILLLLCGILLVIVVMAVVMVRKRNSSQDLLEKKGDMEETEEGDLEKDDEDKMEGEDGEE